jgi:hypothetical protein
MAVPAVLAGALAYSIFNQTFLTMQITQRQPGQYSIVFPRQYVCDSESYQRQQNLVQIYYKNNALYYKKKLLS